MFTNTLDSRAIGFGDTFGQRFMRPGRYSYNIVMAGTGPMTEALPYTIVVEKPDSETLMTQHTITVESNGTTFTVDSETIRIREGDLVAWASSSSSTPRFEVYGNKEFFGSARLVNECGYSHAFGLPGVYEWIDAYNRKIGGVVRVKDVCLTNINEITAWRKTLVDGTLVLIAEGKADPAEVDIVTGQSVFFAVVTGEGISITDRTLLVHQYECSDQTEPAPATPPKASAPKRRTKKN